VQAFESLSTWRQPVPPPASRERAMLIGAVAGWITQLGTGRLRVAVDGLTGSGKTSFGHELAAALRRLGRATMRASMDDFKHPWQHARDHGYDRISGAGHYRNAYDFGSARELLASTGPSSHISSWVKLR
jgi:uridine kinase